MLILQRKVGQSIFIGDEIKISIQEITSDRVKIAIDAPKNLKIVREELSIAEKNNKEALLSSKENVEVFQKLFDK